MTSSNCSFWTLFSVFVFGEEDTTNKWSNVWEKKEKESKNTSKKYLLRTYFENLLLACTSIYYIFNEKTWYFIKCTNVLFRPTQTINNLPIFSCYFVCCCFIHDSVHSFLTYCHSMISCIFALFRILFQPIPLYTLALSIFCSTVHHLFQIVSTFYNTLQLFNQTLKNKHTEHRKKKKLKWQRKSVFEIRMKSHNECDIFCKRKHKMWDWNRFKRPYGSVHKIHGA